jgi:hypothetical protein
VKVFPELLTFFLVLTVAVTPARPTIAQNQRTSEAMASTVLTIWMDSLATDGTDKWNYQQGVLLKGIEGIWHGRRLPPEFGNYKAAKDLLRWIITTDCIKWRETLKQNQIGDQPVT